MPYNPEDAENWWPGPQLGEFCWCWFPQDAPLERGRKPRPCLICQMSKNEQGSRFVVVVAYGTSQKIEVLYPGEFLLRPEDGAAFASSGLKVATKFNLKQRVALPYNSDFFELPNWVAGARSPRLGRLDLSVADVRRRFEAAKAAAGGWN